MKNNESSTHMLEHLSKIRLHGAESAEEDKQTLLAAIENAVQALNVRYRHYGPGGDLRVEPDQWVKAQDVRVAIQIALEEGLLRSIFGSEAR
jgi:hypothetical protein